MKKTIAIITSLILIVGVAAHAGNLDTFHGSTALQQQAEEEPMGGSNAAWVVPLIIVLGLAAASSGGGGGGGDGPEEPEEPEPCKKQALVSNGSGGC